MAEPCFACDGDGYDPFIDGKSAGNCTRCGGGGTERTCHTCGESGDVQDGLCVACRPDEPGDSFYEGRG